MLLSLSEIVAKAQTLKEDSEKVEWLKKNGSMELRTILKFNYDKNVTFLLPNSRPPWKKNNLPGIEFRLYKEIPRMKYFVKGGGYENMNKAKREELFITMLESINDSDAELLVKMLEKQPFENLPLKVVKAAFPQDYQN